jgi:hypothetical protein
VLGALRRAVPPERPAADRAHVRAGRRQGGDLEEARRPRRPGAGGVHLRADEAPGGGARRRAVEAHVRGRRCEAANALALARPFSESSEDEEVLSWKGKCVGARTRRHYGFSWILRSLRSLSDSYSTLSVSDYLGVSDGWSDPPAEEEERVSRLSTLRKAEGTKKTAQDEATRLRRDPHPVVSAPVTPQIHDVFVSRRGKNLYL